MGTDWPVVQEKAVPTRLHAMFESFGLSAGERRDVAGANALRLLGVT
jgi:predicted TIM-barrel fold metal-dependent hydrolase